MKKSTALILVASMFLTVFTSVAIADKIVRVYLQ